jgi:amino acid transporter
VIGLSATAPAYSLAGALGPLAGAVGEKIPAILLVSFLPTLCIAFAYRELCRDTPDCGTTFTWATKAFGPRTGWMSGWGLAVSGIIAVGNAAEIASIYLFRLFGHEASGGAKIAVASAIIVLMTWVSHRGVDLGERMQNVLMAVQFGVLAVISVFALVRVLTHHAGPQSLAPRLSWLVPTGLSTSQFATGVILCVFIYWGWDACLAVGEETQDSARNPGRAAVISTLLLVTTYVMVSYAAQSFAGFGATGIGLNNPSHASDVLTVLGEPAGGQAAAVALLLTVSVSALSSTQTIILPTARQALSMATYRALPERFASVNTKFLTPGFATVVTGVCCLFFYFALSFVSENVLVDSVSSLGLAVAFYYAMTAYACVWYFRRSLMASMRNFLLRGLLPLLGALTMTWAFARSSIDMVDPGYGETHFGPVGGVFVIGVGVLAVGVPLMLLATITGKDFFAGRTLNAQTEARIPPPPDSL